MTKKKEAQAEGAAKVDLGHLEAAKTLAEARAALLALTDEECRQAAAEIAAHIARLTSE